MDKNTSTVQRHQVLFHGKAGEYFSIWLVNALLSMITLGIYSAWATVRRRRYFYGNTEIAGDRFDYHANPIDILKGRIIVFVGFVLFMLLSAILPGVTVVFMLAFLALIPWIVIRSWRYNAIMSSFRGVRFNYHCRVGRAYWVMYAAPVLLILAAYLVMSIFIGIAYSQFETNMNAAIIIGGIGVLFFLLILTAMQGIVSAMTQDLYVNNMFFGTQAFKAELSKKTFIKIVMLSFLIMLPFLLLGGYLVGTFFGAMMFASAMGMTDPEMMNGLMLASAPNLILGWFVLLIGGLVASAYLLVAQRNYVFNQTKLGEQLRLKSSMSTGSYMGLILLNSLIVIFTLGLGAPIAEVRLARYLAERTALEGDISLAGVEAHHDAANSAVAEEVVSAFDLNPGV